jgi:TFIIF-interacting CTD phosphatase-like protein
MWTKLRPGLRAFLQRAAVNFELHICTMGDRDYAQQIAALLDPTRRLFAERIVSSVRKHSPEP